VPGPRSYEPQAAWDGLTELDVLLSATRANPPDHDGLLNVSTFVDLTISKIVDTSRLDAEAVGPPRPAFETKLRREGETDAP